MFYNYKGTHSIVLLAVVDANYRFIYIDVGNYGRQSDGGILSHSTFGKSLDDGTLGLPPTSQISANFHLPYVFVVGDEAFPLKSNVLRPYPGRHLPVAEATFIYRYSNLDPYKSKDELTG